MKDKPVQPAVPDALERKAEEHKEKPVTNVIQLGFIDESRLFKAIIETPRGSRNKYDYDRETGLFELNSVLPTGMSFPYDFGFLPSTLCDDGDPLDILVLTDEPTFPGCLIRTRLLGILEAKQSERGGEPYRNDRLLGVHYKSVLYSDIHTYRDLPEIVLHQLEHFFKAYNEPKGKKFEPLGWHEPPRAFQAIEKAMATFENNQQKRAG